MPRSFAGVVFEFLQKAVRRAVPLPAVEAVEHGVVGAAEDVPAGVGVEGVELPDELLDVYKRQALDMVIAL